MGTHKITNQSKDKIIISIGDPAGIGPEVILKALSKIDFQRGIQPLLIGCKTTLKDTYSKLKAKGVKELINPENLEIYDIPCQEKIVLGQSNIASGKASFTWLAKATQLMLEKKGKALITAPIAKHAWHQAGHDYPGQTELLGELSKVKKPSMLFTAKSPHNGWRLNTLLATTHIPLLEVPKQLSPELIISKLNVLLDFCQRFKKYPKLAIAGLNPHAGEKGQLGSEEIDWIIPTLENWKAKHPNILLDGPMSPDICWISASKAWESKNNVDAPDGILALYHDQGLIPVKIIAFEKAVNTTLGLPFIRTSPDHGTAFDIAGKGIACYQSMLSALETGLELSS